MRFGPIVFIVFLPDQPVTVPELHLAFNQHRYNAHPKKIFFLFV